MGRKAVAVLAAGAVALTMLGGCAPRAAGPRAQQRSPRETRFPVTVTDDAGRKVFVREEPKRIVSLAPANTEILAGLGLTERLVGITTYDDFPPEVRSITKVGDFMTPNLEAIAGARPDLVLATTGVQADVIGRIEEMGSTVIAIDPQTLDALYESIGVIASATGVPERGDALVAQMKEELADIQEAIAEEPAVRCFVEIAQEPLFTAGAGTLVDDLVRAAGGRNVVAADGYVAYSVEQLLEDDPEVYLAMKGSMNDAGAVEDRPGYAGLAAVRTERVHLLDDNLVSRPGPRVVQGVELIARALHPEAFEAE